MKKLLVIGGVLVALVVVGVVVTSFFLGNIVKAGVNKFGPTITQTKVELQSASISPLSGSGTLSGLSVGNPTGWSVADAFKLGKVHLSLEPFSVLKETIVINELTIENPEFLYETKIVASNVTDLMKNIEKSLGGDKSAEPKTKDGKPIKLIVRKLVLKGGRVTLGVGGAGGMMTLPMPQVDMVDIGVKEGGVTPAQLAFAIMGNVVPSIVSASTQALTKIGGTSGAAAVEGARQIGGAIKGLFGGGEKKPEPAPATPPVKK